jgi:hypothetical protein
MRTGDKFRNIVVMPAIFLAFFLTSADSLAQNPVGTVVTSRGDVSVTSNGELRPLKQGELIYEHDELSVSSRSFTVLQFMDGAKVTLRPDSKLIIEQYLPYAATLNLLSGGFRVVAGGIASTQPEDYRIRTPIALMSVEGSESSLTLCGDEICEQQGLLEILE